MMMLARVRFHPNRPMVHADFSQHPAFQERTHILVNRRQRDGRNLFSYSIVDKLWARMAVQGHYGVVDDAPLVRRCQVMPAAERLKLSST